MFFILLGALLFLSNATIVKQQSDLYYEGRSGDIIVSTDESAGIQLSWDLTQNVLQDVQVYNMFARMFRVPRSSIMAEINTPVDLFSRPKGNLLFSIEGLTEKLIPGGAQILGAKPIRGLTPEARQPFTPASLLGSVLTGFSPRQHGVVNKRWPSMKSVNEMYTVNNLFDYYLQYNPSEPILSASSCRYAAAVLAPHSENVRASGSASMHWDSNSGKFISSSADSQFAVSRTDFATTIASIAKLAGLTIKYDEAESVVTVGSVSFDLSEESVDHLLAEVSYVYTIGSNAQVAPKFFSFHFTSLKMIARQYGAQSEEYKFAVALVDAAIAYAIDSYGEEVTHSIVYHSDNQVEAEKTVSTITIDFIATESSVLPTATFSKYYPHIYLAASERVRNQLCAQIDKALSGQKSSPKVYCATKISNKRSAQEYPYNNNPNDTELSRRISGFHVVTWMAVALFFILLTAIYYLFTMDTAQDSMLFFKSNMALAKGAGPARQKKSSASSVS